MFDYISYLVSLFFHSLIHTEHFRRMGKALDFRAENRSFKTGCISFIIFIRNTTCICINGLN